jgi:hypothetical protein
MISFGGGIALALLAVQLTAASAATDSSNVKATGLRRPLDLISPGRTRTALPLTPASTRAGRYPGQMPGIPRLPQPLPAPRKEFTLREARRRAGLSQVELAARAGVTQSVISAYEAGHRLRRLSGPVGRQVRRRPRDLVAAAAAHGVHGLQVSGSVARGQDRPDSDVDLLADLAPGMSLFGLARLQADLEAILGSRVEPIAWCSTRRGSGCWRSARPSRHCPPTCSNRARHPLEPDRPHA